MFDMIIRFFKFLLPIVKTAAVQVAADELQKAAYPARDYSRRRPLSSYNSFERSSATRNDCTECGRSLGTPHYSYCSQFVDLENLSSDEALTKLREKLTGEPAQTEEFHDVLLVALDLKGRSAEQVHLWLHDQMPECMDYPRGINLDSWWVANDERFDGSDTDSAIFVTKGQQEPARQQLRAFGYTND